MKRLPYIGLLFLSLYSVFSNATIIITSIESRSSGCEGAGQVVFCYKDYKVTWRQIPGPLDNEVIPSPIDSYGPMEEHDHFTFGCNIPGQGLFPGVTGSTCIDLVPGMTWKQAEDAWIRSYGPTGPAVVGHSGASDSRECVMFAGMPGKGAFIGEQVGNGPLVCVGAPPDPDPQCVIEGNPVFNFDITLGQNASGMQRSTTVNLRCILPANVTLMDATGNSGRVELGWGHADVKVNGLTLPMSLTSNPSLPLEITATLHGIPTQAGVAEGSVVIVVGYQ